MLGIGLQVPVPIPTVLRPSKIRAGLTSAYHDARVHPVLRLPCYGFTLTVNLSPYQVPSPAPQ